MHSYPAKIPFVAPWRAAIQLIGSLAAFPVSLLDLTAPLLSKNILAFAKAKKGGSDAAKKAGPKSSSRKKGKQADKEPDEDRQQEDGEGDYEEYQDYQGGEDGEDQETDRGEAGNSGAGPPDSELIERFLEGDEGAFNRLVLKYQTKVYNLCYRVMGDPHEAQDMAQEVFMTAHKSLKDFRGESLFSTWIYRVTVNHCKNRIKFLARRRYYHSTSMDQPIEADEGDIYFEPEDEAPSPEAEMASQQVQHMVQEAINSLDPDHRMAVILRDIQELSYEEIAETLDIRVGTVKSRIHRARNELKKKLQNRMKQWK